MSHSTYSAGGNAIFIAPKRIEVTSEIFIGKDILELLTGAMYVDPLCIYREYIQNSCDSIDEALQTSTYSGEDFPRIDINFDQASRSVRIRDNGTGISNQDFIRVLTSIGGSHKRGQKQRGFRGVGRLSGLGYCQELVFRSRAHKTDKVAELVWDGRRLKEVLRQATGADELGEAVRAITSFTLTPSIEAPARFFEVELRKLVRVRNDILLNEGVVRSYLGQVAPVSFKPAFQFAGTIDALLQKHRLNSVYDIYLNDGQGKVYRPHHDSFPINEKVADTFSGIQTFEIEGINGDIAAVGWILDHSYFGAIPKRAEVAGLRFRSGNIQVGSFDIATALFPEARFNSWAVGEVHVLSSSILPNGRRDDFEPSGHYQHFLGALTPFAREISKNCRDKSVIRNRLKAVESKRQFAQEALSLIRRRDQLPVVRRILLQRVEKAYSELVKLTESKSLKAHERVLVDEQTEKIARSLEKLRTESEVPHPLKDVHPTKRVAYDHVIEIIYSLIPNLTDAHSLSSQVIKAVRNSANR